MPFGSLHLVHFKWVPWGTGHKEGGNCWSVAPKGQRLADQLVGGYMKHYSGLNTELFNISLISRTKGQNVTGGALWITSNLEMDIQKHFDRLVTWVEKNFTKSSNSKCKVLPGTDCLEGSLAGNVLGLPARSKLNSCVLLWQRWEDCILGYIKSVEGMQNPPLSKLIWSCI